MSLQHWNCVEVEGNCMHLAARDAAYVSGTPATLYTVHQERRCTPPGPHTACMTHSPACN